MCYGYPEICPSAYCQMPLNPASNMTFEVLQGLFYDLTGGERGAGLFPEVCVRCKMSLC
jgi:hexosaminidase